MNSIINTEKQTLPADIRLRKILGDKDMDALLERNKSCLFHAGDVIVKQGQLSNGMYIILEGTAVVSAKKPGGGTLHLETLVVGCFFGEISYIEQSPSVTSVTAESGVQCLYISDAYLKMLASFYPEIRYRIFQAICLQLCERLGKMHDEVIAHISGSDMATTSLFGKIIGTLAKPAGISTDEALCGKPLTYFPPFGLFSPEEQSLLLEQGTFFKTAKNTTIIQGGEKTASCLAVLRGAVRSQIVHKDKAARLSTIGPGILFAGIACVNPKAAFTVTFVTCEAAILYGLPEEALTWLQKNHPLIWFKLFDLICRSLVELERSVDKLDVRLGIEAYNIKTGE